MRLDHTDYIKLVFAGFKKKQQDSERPLLPAFTRASIRQECHKVYLERLGKGERQETKTLRDFFGVPYEAEDIATRIEWYPLDKFRPLENLMRGRIQNPVQVNVELLAWLIDFKHRPYTTGMNVLLNEEEMAILNKPKSGSGDFEPSTKDEEESKTENEASSSEYEEYERPGGKKNRIKVIAGFLLALTLGGVYMARQDKTTGCMYWVEDHYERIACDDVREGALILPLNEKRMTNFKRIMRTDTITAWSIGRIYYIKRNNTIEYYTKGGRHPVEPTRSLWKLSRYMFDKYLSKKEMESEASISTEKPKFINNR